MRILTLADEESKSLWDHFDKAKFKDIDLILSAGDLNPDYLSFLVTLTSIPILYVHGNHDEKYTRKPPEGCICIEDQIYVHEGIRILGLGGSMRYKPGMHQFTEREMKKRVQKLWLPLTFKRGFDILLTHSPALGLNDGRDLPHQGFQVFNTLLDKYHPKFFIHGHVHLSYGKGHRRYDQYQNTHIINAYEKCVIDYEGNSEKEIMIR